MGQATVRQRGHGCSVNEFYERAEAFLFGRRTYDVFAGYWGVQSGNPIADALNSRPKYVVSNSLTDPQWTNTTVISGDVAAAIRELKAKPGGELQVHGSGNLVRWLLENDLVDEMNPPIVPVVVGQGTRLFPDSGPDMALDLLNCPVLPEGHYAPGLPAVRAPAVCNRLKPLKT